MKKHDNQENFFEIPLWGYRVKSQLRRCPEYMNYIFDLKSKYPSIQKSNFGGWHSELDLHDHEMFYELKSLIMYLAEDIVEPYTTSKLKFLEMWTTVNGKGNYNAHHTHRGIISGIFYVKVPKDSGRVVFCNPAIRAFNHPISKSDLPVDPEPAALMFFPSWLEHYVEPNNSDEERIVISFNLGETD